MLDSGSELNLIRERTAQQLDLPISSLPPQMTGGTLKTTDGAQSSIIGFIQTPVTIGKVSILTTFVVVKEMSYKIILGEPWAVRAQLAMERTATGQVSCIIRSEDSLWETRFLAVHGDPNVIKKDEVLEQRDDRVARTTVEQQAPLQANV